MRSDNPKPSSSSKHKASLPCTNPAYHFPRHRRIENQPTPSPLYLSVTQPGTPSPETWEIRHNEHRHSHPNGLPFHNLHDPESGSVLTDPRSERLGDRRRIIGQPQPRLPYQRDHGAGSQNAGHSCGDFIFQGRRRSEGRYVCAWNTDLFTKRRFVFFVKSPLHTHIPPPPEQQTDFKDMKRALGPTFLIKG